jgi:hypothetical protein
VVWGAAGSKATRSAPNRGGLSASERAKYGGWRFKAEPVVIQSTRVVALIGDQLTSSPSQLVDTLKYKKDTQLPCPKVTMVFLKSKSMPQPQTRRSYVASSSYAPKTALMPNLLVAIDKRKSIQIIQSGSRSTLRIRDNPFTKPTSPQRQFPFSMKGGRARTSGTEAALLVPRWSSINVQLNFISASLSQKRQRSTNITINPSPQRRLQHRRKEGRVISWQFR